MNDIHDIVEAAKRLAEDRGFQNELAQIRARAALQQLSGQEEHIRWTYIMPRVVRNASGLLSDLQLLAEDSPENLDSLKSHALLLAQCWEGLSRLRDGLDGTSGLI